MTLERRNDAVPDSRLDALYDIVSQQSKTSERLLVISEQQQRSIDKLNTWVDDHEARYHKMDVEFSLIKASVNNWSSQFGDMKEQVRQLVDAIRIITASGLKIQGGWITLTIICTLAMGLVTLLKTFGVI